MFAGGDLESSSYQIELLTRYGRSAYQCSCSGYEVKRDFSMPIVVICCDFTVYSSFEASLILTLCACVRLVEGVMRSVNNLLEKFHQSFFLYLLCSPSKFVSVGLYMIPLGLLLVTLPLGAAALNSALVAADEVGPGSKSSPTRTPGSTREDTSAPKDSAVGMLDIKTTKECVGRWRHAIIVVSAVQLWSFLVALLPPAVSSLVDLLQTSLASPTSEFASASLKMSLWAGLAVLSLFVLLGSLPGANPGDWMAVKALVLGLATIGLVVISQVDFAVSLMGALVLVPTCLGSSPWPRSTQRKFGCILGTFVTVLGLPPFLLAGAILLGNAHGQVISLGRLWQWTELLWSGGSVLYIFLVVVYLPSSYFSLHVLFS